MSLLAGLTALLTPIVAVETGIFSGAAPVEYIVITPLADTFEVYADNSPEFEVQEARLSLFSKQNYLQRKRQIEGALLQYNYTITDRRYIGFERDTGYHHYAIDVAKEYKI